MACICQASSESLTHYFTSFFFTIAKCPLPTMVSQNFLEVTDRSQQWAGPHQILNNANFAIEEDLKVTFGFDIQPNEMITSTWKMKITVGEEISYYSILRYKKLSKIFFSFILHFSISLISTYKGRFFSKKIICIYNIKFQTIVFARSCGLVVFGRFAHI